MAEVIWLDSFLKGLEENGIDISRIKVEYSKPEEEQLYKVEVAAGLGLTKTVSTNVVYLDYRYEEPRFADETRHLTEEDIKNFDPRYWIGGFAEKV